MEMFKHALDIASLWALPFIILVILITAYFKKVPVLILAILHLLSTSLCLVFGIALSSWEAQYAVSLSSMMPQNDLSVNPEDVNIAVSSSLFSTIAVSIPVFIVGVLMFLGFLLLFIKSRNSNPNASPKAGAVILFILSVIEMIASIIITILLFVGILLMALGIGVFATSSMNSQSDVEIFSILMAVMMIFTAVFAFVQLFYSIHKMRYFKSIKNSLSSVDLYYSGAGAYGVMNIIFTVFSLIGIGLAVILVPVTGEFTDVMAMGAGYSIYEGIDVTAVFPLMLFCGLTLLLIIVTMIFEAVVALGYKSYIKNIKSGYRTPDIPAAPYQPAAPAGFVTPQQQPYYPAQPTVQQQTQQGFPQYHSDEIDLVMPAGFNSFSCPVCNMPVSSDALFCPKCGQKLK